MALVRSRRQFVATMLRLSGTRPHSGSSRNGASLALAHLFPIRQCRLYSSGDTPYICQNSPEVTMNTRTLVTGGCGFIGSHIVARLVENGDSVSVLDDLSTGRHENLPASPLVTFHLGSVLDTTAIKRAAEGTDRVIHLASVVGMRLASTNTTGAYHVSAEGTSRVLAGTSNAPVVMFSSSAIYPASADRAHHETDTLSSEAALTYDGGQRGYACGKLRLERLAMEASKSGRRVLIIRPFNIIGKWWSQGSWRAPEQGGRCRSTMTVNRPERLATSAPSWIVCFA
jgi:nucleoside-diphosphate-sugar epimerase